MKNNLKKHNCSKSEILKLTADEIIKLKIEKENINVREKKFRKIY